MLLVFKDGLQNSTLLKFLFYYRIDTVISISDVIIFEALKSRLEITVYSTPKFKFYLNTQYVA